MSISAIVVRGYGSFGSVYRLPTLGYGSAEVVPVGVFRRGPTTRHGNLMEQFGTGRPRSIGTHAGRHVSDGETTDSNNPLQSR